MTRKVLGIAVALLVVGLLAAGLGLNLWFNNWLRGPEFTRLVAQQTGKSLGGNAAFSPFVWDGPSVFSQQVELIGSVGKPVSNAKAEQVRAEVNWRAALSGIWHVRRIDITRLDMVIASGAPRAMADELAIDAVLLDPIAPSRSGIASWLPSKFQLDEVAIQDANAKLGPGGGIRNTVLTIKPEGAGWIFDAIGGKYDPPAVLGPLDIETFRIRLQQGVVYLTDAQLRSGAAGRINATGEIGSAQRPMDLRIDWQNIDAADVLDASWREKLTGLVSGDATIVQSPTTGVTTKGKFALTEGMLSGLPVQEEIARFTRAPQFTRMPIHELSSEFVTDGSKTDFVNFVMESKGLLRMTGNGTLLADGSITGDFQIGVTQQTLQWLPGSQEKVFTESRDGYLWTNIRIGGTLDRPSEDLSPRLATALGEQLIETGRDIIENAPQKTQETIDRVIDVLSPFLR